MEREWLVRDVRVDTRSACVCVAVLSRSAAAAEEATRFVGGVDVAIYVYGGEAEVGF